MSALISYQLGVLLGGVFFIAACTAVLDSFVDVIQTRVLAIAKDEERPATKHDIVSLARTLVIKHAIIILLIGGMFFHIELHRWNNVVSPIVLLALFGRSLFLLLDAVVCLNAPHRIPRGLPKSVIDG